jgi:hypothetical protein
MYQPENKTCRRQINYFGLTASFELISDSPPALHRRNSHHPHAVA